MGVGMGVDVFWCVFIVYFFGLKKIKIFSFFVLVFLILDLRFSDLLIL